MKICPLGRAFIDGQERPMDLRLVWIKLLCVAYKSWINLVCGTIRY